MSNDTVVLIIASAAVIIGLSGIYIAWPIRGMLRKFFVETGHDQFGEVLLSHQRQLRRNQESAKKVDERLDHLEAEAQLLVNQVGLVRYNPFSDTGGNMSFSMALINNHGDVIVITSLHSRDGIRMYAKTVKNFSSDQALTAEEKGAIERAKRKI